MRFVLTNDDGIDAAGLAALAEAARAHGTVAVVAPACNWSVCGHIVTTDKPLRAQPLGKDRWAVEGTPSDCIRLALTHLEPETNWVLAGINHGGNLGADVYHSGTVAAVREATLLGRPAIGFSHYRKRGMAVDWSRAVGWVERVLASLLTRPMVAGTFWNVNLPHLRSDEPDPRIIECPLDRSPLPVAFRREAELFHYAGDYHARPRVAGSDIDVCFGGNIAVTLLHL